MSTSNWSDKEHLTAVQYKNASNLSARASLHQRFSTNPQGWFDWIFERLHLPAECRLLELGCGNANLWVENRQRIPSGWQLTLTDLSEGMLKEAKQRLAGLGNLHFRVVDVEAIPFEDAGFDAVLANHMLYHVPDRPKAFSEIRRVLRPEGRFYASTLGRSNMRELSELLSGFDPALTGRGSGEVLSFTLENGAAQLQPYFDSIQLHRFEDALHVTEAEPFVQYARSMYDMKARLAGERLSSFRDYVERELKKEGVIRIRKETGLFEARRASIP